MKSTRFLDENSLNEEIANLFKNAKKHLILISPYIKFHDKLLAILESKKSNPNLKITIVFGKNHTDLSKSLGYSDFHFLTTFPNIQILYQERLHAKYYANEHDAIQTSMNLHSHSQNNNIETGILTKSNLLHKIKNKIWDENVSFDLAASKYFNSVLEQSKLLYNKKPIYQRNGILKKYTNSELKKDELSDFFELKSKSLILNNTIAPKNKTNNSSVTEKQSLFNTGKIARDLGMKTFEFEKKLHRNKLIEIKNNKYIVTPLGKEKGGQMRIGKNGEFVVFPLKIRAEI